jgi:tetratricopeptide (TPR) repeat protein
LVNELHNYTPAIFVGEPTAENINFYGDNQPVELPNSGIIARLSFAWWQDKPQWENDDWLAPNLATDLSFTEYQNNEDPALAAIWNFDSDTPIVEPLEYLTELFTTGRAAEIGPEAKRMLADPLYRYYPFEDRLNRTGYRLMNGQQMEPALFVFNLITELFPESPNAWDSLAEAHWRTGQMEQAIALYEKAIAMDPEGPTGENARAMLAEIRKEKE